MISISLLSRIQPRIEFAERLRWFRRDDSESFRLVLLRYTLDIVLIEPVRGFTLRVCIAELFGVADGLNLAWRKREFASRDKQSAVLNGRVQKCEGGKERLLPNLHGHVEPGINCVNALRRLVIRLVARGQRLHRDDRHN